MTRGAGATLLRASAVAAALAGGIVLALLVSGSRRQVPAPAAASPTGDRRRWAVTSSAASISGRSSVDFYNMKTKSTVSVPEDQVRKRRMVRTTSGGKRQERYAAVAEVDVQGRPVRMFKFLSKEQFDGLSVPEEKE